MSASRAGNRERSEGARLTEPELPVLELTGPELTGPELTGPPPTRASQLSARAA